MFICIYVPLYNRSYHAYFGKQIKDYTYQHLKRFAYRRLKCHKSNYQHVHLVHLIVLADLLIFLCYL